MKYFFNLFVAFLMVFIITSCDDDKKENAIYFGGKIINPKSEFVLLHNQDKVIDSLFLDEDDTFLGRYTDLKEGLYYFEHGPEHQFIYMQPNDSILIRLNTWDFDESLVFSGKGADKNNILIDYFIESENEDKNYKFYSFYSLESSAFKEKMDSVLTLKNEKIEAFKVKNPTLTAKYLELLNITAKYPIYNRFERYPEANRKHNKLESHPEVVNLFYDYRANINTNKDSLMFYGTYSRYIVERLYNDVYTEGITPEKSEFIISLLNAVNKNIHTEELRNTFLKRMLINDFYRKSSCDIDKDAFFAFFKLSTSIDDKKQVQRLLNDVKQVHKGSKLSDFNVLDYNQSERSIHKLIKNKNSVVYFWNPKFISESYLASRVSYLGKKFPEINFIGIKFASSEINPVKGIDIKNQFYIDNASNANLFLSSQYPRALLINKKRTVVNGYTAINSQTIVKQIKKLQKR